MPQDFFADGFGEQQGVIFTKEQDEFLEKKIVLLDPMKTYQISLARVLALLKYTKLDPQSIKKILQNSCASGIGQKVITYDEMKKIFRGVALKQNKMEPSKINIEANIKTKMPILYDDDQSDEQQPQQPQLPQSQTLKPQQQKKPPQSVTQSQQLSHPPRVQAPVDPLKAYDDYWKGLKTKNHLIDGSEVKKLFSNNNLNKQNLSKSWKLCNLSQQGALTKGQFFIFMNLINSNNIPESLTKQMKDFIHKIQDACGYKKNGGNQQGGQKVTPVPAPTQKPSERKSSEAFDKFGGQNLFAKNASKVQESTKQLKSSNIFPTAPSNLPPGRPSNTASLGDMSKSALFLLQKVENLSKQEKKNQKEVQGIVANNEQLLGGLVTIEQFLTAVQKNMESTTSQIEILKQSQNSLNERLNNVCLQFKSIIQKQSECINFMKQSIHAENQSNNGRLQILQSYTQQMLSIVDSSLQSTQIEVAKMKNQSQQNYNKVVQGFGDKMKGNNQMIANSSPAVTKVNEKQISAPHSPQYQGYRPQDPFSDHEGHEEHQEDEQEPEPQHLKETVQIQKNITQNVVIEQKVQSNQNQQEEPHIYLENLSPQQRKKTKQMLLIKILNSVSSMNEEEYAQVVNKVVAMTEEQMNQSYTKLHALYLQNLAKNPSLPKYPVPTPQQFTATMEEKNYRF